MKQLGKLAGLSNQHILQQQLQKAYDGRDTAFKTNTHLFYTRVNSGLSATISLPPLSSAWDSKLGRLATDKSNVQRLVQEHWTTIFRQEQKVIPNGEREKMYRCPRYQEKHKAVPEFNPLEDDIPEHEVQRVLALNPDKAAGMDLINKRSLLAGGDVVLKYLTALVNAMRITGATPDGCK